MEALKLTRADYQEGLEKINEAVSDNTSYLDKFTVNLPEGLNSANCLEICRAMQDPSLEQRIRLTKICIAGKNVSVTCPNGETESFKIINPDDTFDAFELFKKEPMALMAVADCVYGYILKKSVRLSKPKAAAAAVTD